METWVSEVTKLAEFALSQPQACYAAYTFGLKHRWTYFLRTLSDTQDLQEPLKKAISHVLIPAITKQVFNQNDRYIISFPPRHGGLGITNPCTEPCLEYSSSIKVTAPLVEKIVSQSHELPEENDARSVKQEALRDSEQVAKDKLRNFKDTLPKKSYRALDLAAEKGASTWLTVIPPKEMGFNLNKREFKDALRLRYNWPFSDIPSKCVCGEGYSVEHAMICNSWRLIIQRHD